MVYLNLAFTCPLYRGGYRFTFKRRRIGNAART